MLTEEQHLELLTKMLFSESGKTMLKRDQSQVENVCGKCNKRCKTPGGIKRHMKIHSVSDCLRCTICNYVTESYDCFVLHFKKAHSGEASFSCKQCMYRTTNSSYFARHLMVHSGKRYNCLQSRMRLNQKYNSTIRIKPHSKEKLKNCQYLRKKSFANPYACNYCNDTFLQKCSLIAHVESLHSGENMSISSDEPGKAKNFACPHCSYRTALRLCLARHMVAGCDEKLHRCVQCHFSSKWKHSLQRHVELKHRGGTKLEALGTANQYDGYRPVKTQSLKTKKKTLYNCNHCSYKAHNMHRLIQHSMIHSGVRLYKCPSCTYSSRWPACLKRHIRAQHRGEANVPDMLKKTILSNKLKAEVLKCSATSKSGAKPFSCNQCSFRAAFKHSLTRHLKIHTCDILYSCPKCSYVSIRKDNVRVHMRSLHLEEKSEPLACNPNLKASKKGEKISISMKQTSRCRLVKAKSPKVTEKASFNCNHCNHKAPNMYRLIHHSMIHSGLKPYTCPSCTFSSRWPNNLKRHIRAKHSGENIVPGLFKSTILTNKFKAEVLKRSVTSKSGAKPFSCNQCSFRAAFKHSLTRHLKSHTSDVLYSCPKCSYVSIRKDHVRVHMRSLHLEEKGEPLPYMPGSKASKKGEKMSMSMKPSDISNLVKAKLPEAKGKTRYNCNHCNYKAPNMYRLIHHSMIHSGLKPYICPCCPYASRWTDELKKHIRTKHPGEKDVPGLLMNTILINKFKAEVLKQSKTSKSGAKQFSCNQCSFRAAFKHSLTRHLKTHTSCYVSNEKENVQSQMRSLHLVEKDEPLPCTPSSKASKKLKTRPLRKSSKLAHKGFVCSKCNYRADCEWRLAHHLMIHSGKKPYKCPYCTHTTRWFYDFKKHMKSKHPEKDDLKLSRLLRRINKSVRSKLLKKHLKNKYHLKKPFACFLCNYRASSKQLLDHHSMVHVGETPLKCESELTENLETRRKPKDSKEEIIPAFSENLKLSNNPQESSLFKTRMVKNCVEKSLTCNLCGFKAKNGACLTRHTMVHSGVEPYQCEYCIFASGRKCNLKKHVKLKHPKKEINSGPSEGKGESNNLEESSRIRGRARKHSEETSVSCKKSTYKAELKHHLNSQDLSIRSVRKPHKCLHCRYATSTTEQLRKHIELKHMVKKVEVENVNSSEQKKESYESSVVQGPYLHKGTEKKAACPHCNFKTDYLQSLKRHLYIHFEEKHFKCSQCPYASRQSYNLNMHIKKNHRETDVVSRFVHKRSNLIKESHSTLEATKKNLLKPTENPNTAPNSGVSNSYIVGNSGKNPFALNRVKGRMGKAGPNKKSYNCPHCTYLSRLPQTLQTHIRIQHSGMNFGSHVHSCMYDNCGYKTLVTSHFNTHLLTHTGIKAYQCQKCEKSFTQKGNLNIHMKAMHPSEEEFACGLCSFKTINFNQLKMHLITSHDEEES